jgi:hypothetical protein
MKNKERGFKRTMIALGVGAIAFTLTQSMLNVRKVKGKNVKDNVYVPDVSEIFQ